MTNAPTEPGKSRSSASGAYDLLLTAIEGECLPPGTRLREAELATRFQISPTPVREVLKRLELEGLARTSHTMARWYPSRNMVRWWNCT